MEHLIAAIILALLIYGLERNRIRQGRGAHHLAGSTDIQDRDTERISCELSFRS